MRVSLAATILAALAVQGCEPTPETPEDSKALPGYAPEEPIEGAVEPPAPTEEMESESRTR